MINNYTKDEIEIMNKHWKKIKFYSHFKLLKVNFFVLIYYISYFLIILFLYSFVILIKYLSIILISLAFLHDTYIDYLYSIIHIHLLFWIEFISYPIIFSTKHIENVKIKFLLLFISILGFLISKSLIIYSFIYTIDFVYLLIGIFCYWTIFVLKNKQFYLKAVLALENIIIFVGLYLKNNFNYYLIMIFLLLNICLWIIFYLFNDKINFIKKLNKTFFFKRIFFVITCILWIYFQLNIIVLNYIHFYNLLKDYIIFLSLNQKNFLIIITYIIIDLIFSTIVLINNNYLKKFKFFKNKKKFIKSKTFYKIPSYIYIYKPPDIFFKQKKKLGIIINDGQININHKCLICLKRNPDLIMNECGHFLICIYCKINQKSKGLLCPKCKKFNKYFILIEKNILYFIEKYIKN